MRRSRNITQTTLTWINSHPLQIVLILSSKIVSSYTPVESHTHTHITNLRQKPGLLSAVGINESLRPKQAFSWYPEGKAGANYIKVNIPAIKTPAGEKKHEYIFTLSLRKMALPALKGTGSCCLHLLSNSTSITRLQAGEAERQPAPFPLLSLVRTWLPAVMCV